jgi:hypothetical protein
MKKSFFVILDKIAFGVLFLVNLEFGLGMELKEGFMK